MYENSFTFTKMLAAYAKPHKFTGRSTRTELLGYLIISWFVGALVSRFLMFGAIATSGELGTYLQSLNIVNLLLWLPFPALAVRRFHDQDKPGWWALPLILPTILFFLGGYAILPQPLQLVIGLLNLALLVLLFWKPTDGENHYGLDPRLNPYEETFT